MKVAIYTRVSTEDQAKEGYNPGVWIQGKFLPMEFFTEKFPAFSPRKEK